MIGTHSSLGVYVLHCTECIVAGFMRVDGTSFSLGLNELGVLTLETKRS